MKHLKLSHSLYVFWLEEFHKNLLLRGIGNGKMPMYVTHVREFLHYLEDNLILDFRKISSEVFQRYLQFILNRPNQRQGGLLSPISIQHHLQSDRSFFDFLIDCKVVNNNPVRLCKFKNRTQKPREIVTVEEIRTLFRRRISPHNKAMLCCAYGCGLRRSEIQQLNLDEIHLKEHYIQVRNGKGGKSRIVPIPHKISVYLEKYIQSIGENWVFEDNGKIPFFINSIGNRMTGNTLNQHLKKIICHANLPLLKSKNITLHCLRHSIAVHLIENGAKIELVKDFLGHSQIDTTQLYAIRRRRSNSVMRAFR